MYPGRSHPVPAAHPSVIARSLVTPGPRARTRRGMAVVGAAAVLAVVASACSGPQSAEPALPVPAARTGTASPTSTATEAPTVPPVTAHEGLPVAQPMPPGLLASTTDAWTMFSINSRSIGGDQRPTTGIWAGLPTVLYLLDPAGALYEVPSAQSVWDPTVDWLPGSSLAIRISAGDSHPTVQVVDLLTSHVLSTIDRDVPDAGIVSAFFLRDGTQDILVTTEKSVSDDPAKAEYSLTRRSPSGDILATGGPFVGGVGGVSADRRSILVGGSPQHVVSLDGFTDVRTLQLPYPNQTDACWSPQWMDDVRVLVECSSTGKGVGADRGLWIVPTNGGSPSLLAPGRAVQQTWSTRGAATALLTIAGSIGGTTELTRIDAQGTLTPLREVADRDVVLLDPLWIATPGSIPGSSDIAAVDPATGVSTVVFTMASELVQNDMVVRYHSLG